MKRGILICLLALLLCLGAAQADPLTLPGALTVIDEGAFLNTLAAEEVILPEGAKRIESKAFSGSGVKRVFLPETLEYIAPDAFDGCEGLTAWGPAYTAAEAYCAEQGIPYDALVTPAEEFTFSFPSDTAATVTGWNGEGTAVYMPEMADETHRITAVGANAFKGKTSLRKVMLAPGVETVGGSAFQGCTALEDVAFSGVLREIGSNAFRGCTALEEADLPDSLTVLGSFAFQGCAALSFLHYPLSLANKGISAGAFQNCPSLTRVEVTEGVTSLTPILHDAAYLEELVLPDSLTKIQSGALQGCTGLKAVMKAGGRTRTEDEVFVELPPNLETVGSDAFRNWPALQHVYFNDGLREIGSNAFRDCILLEEADLPDSVTTVGAWAFQGCAALHSFHYPLSLNNNGIFTGAFQNCPSLTKAWVPEGVDILARVFHDAVYLEELVLPDSLTKIQSGALQGCTGLKAVMKAGGRTQTEGEVFVELPPNLETVGSDAFRNWPALQHVYFNDGLREIGSNAFRDCVSLQEAELPDSVTTIGAWAFQGCAALHSFHYPLSLNNDGIFTGAFQNCPSLPRTGMPEGVDILARVFRGAEYLEELTLPNSLTRIRSNALRDCAALPWLYVPVSVAQLEADVFTGCPLLTVESEYGAEAISYCEKNGVPYYYLSLIGCNKPSVVYVGEGFTLYGTVRSNIVLEQVSAVLTDLKTGETLVNFTTAPGTNAYSLADELSGLLNLSNRPVGSYRLTVGAGTTLTSETFFTVDFKVQMPPLRINTENASLPGGIVFLMEKLRLSGTLTANYPIDSVYAELSNAQGVRISSYSATPGTKTLDLDPIAVAIGAFTQTGDYYFVFTVTGHGETKTLVDRTITCGNYKDASVVRADPLFSKPIDYSLNKLAFWSAEFAMDAYSDGSYIEKECWFRTRQVSGQDDLIKCVLMWKDIDNLDGTYTRLYAIGVQGTRGVGQWSSNFVVGDGDYHQGFKEAADFVMERFTAYRNKIESQYTRDPANTTTKVWVCGHSRGAAVANLLGGKLLPDAGFSQQNIYAFCFACPNVIKGKDKAAPQVRVYNIAGDYVPALPFNSWGYGRYGTLQGHIDTDQIYGGVHTRAIDVLTESTILPYLTFLDVNFKNDRNIFLPLLAQVIAEQNMDTVREVLLGLFMVYSKHPVRFTVSKDATLDKLATDLYNDMRKNVNFLERVGNTHNMDTYLTWMKSEYPNFMYNDYLVD